MPHSHEVVRLCEVGGDERLASVEVISDPPQSESAIEVIKVYGHRVRFEWVRSRRLSQSRSLR